jgi:hypothetical protein
VNFIRVGLGRRFAALAIDWGMSLAIASLFTSRGSGLSAFAPLGVLFIEVWILTSLSGASAGQRILRFRVIRFDDGGMPTPGQVLIRTVLLCLVVTAVTFDENGRGLHERLSGTVLTR